MQSGIHGWGMFAVKPMKAGEMVMEYRGVLLRKVAPPTSLPPAAKCSSIAGAPQRAPPQQRRCAAACLPCAAATDSIAACGPRLMCWRQLAVESRDSWHRREGSVTRARGGGAGGGR